MALLKRIFYSSYFKQGTKKVKSEIIAMVSAGESAIQSAKGERVGGFINIYVNPNRYIGKEFCSFSLLGESMNPEFLQGDIATGIPIKLEDEFCIGQNEQDTLLKISQFFAPRIGEYFIFHTEDNLLIKMLKGFDIEKRVPIFESLNPAYPNPNITSIEYFYGNLYHVLEVKRASEKDSDFSEISSNSSNENAQFYFNVNIDTVILKSIMPNYKVLEIELEKVIDLALIEKENTELLQVLEKSDSLNDEKVSKATGNLFKKLLSIDLIKNINAGFKFSDNFKKLLSGEVISIEKVNEALGEFLVFIKELLKN